MRRSKYGVSTSPPVLIEHMSSYIINSRSDNTAKSYYYSFNRWSTFAKKHSFDVLPAQPVHIALFITHSHSIFTSLHKKELTSSKRKKPRKAQQNHGKISYNQQIIIT
jgi:hypothetical protein